MSEAIRLNKWLSQMGITSRRTAETWIREGRIAINGETVGDLGRRLVPGSDQVTIDGKLVNQPPPPRVYWLFNKPDATLTATRDRDKETIFDLPKLRNLPFQVSPVGRLDYRTEGLLLLSNDGEFVHRLTHPSFKMPRHYLALINGRLARDELHTIRDNLVLEDGPVSQVSIRFADGKRLGATKGSWYMITVHEGRNRLVRRIFEHFGYKVVRLVRDGFGELRLPEELPPGEFRQLSPSELASLKRAVGLERPKAKSENTPIC